MSQHSLTMHAGHKLQKSVDEISTRINNLSQQKSNFQMEIDTASESFSSLDLFYLPYHRSLLALSSISADKIGLRREGKTIYFL